MQLCLNILWIKSEFDLKLTAKLRVVLVDERVDLLDGIEDEADRLVVVESIDDVGNVLAHTYLNIPRLGSKLGIVIDEVGGEDLIDDTFLVSLIEALKTVGKESEGGKVEDSLCTALLDLLCNVKERVAGGDHIVNDDNVLARQILTEVFVRDDGVLAVYDTGVIAALVEHTDVKPRNRGEEHTSAHCALVGRDDDELFLIKGNIGDCLYECLYHLICRTVVVKTDKRNCILNAVVVCVKGDKVLYAVEFELAEHHSAVERFAVGSLVLSALIEHGHNDRNTARLTLDSSDDTLEVSKMLVWCHRDIGTSHFICDTVVKGVAEDHNVKTSDRLFEQALCLTRSKTGAVDLHEIRFVCTSALSEIIVNAVAKSFAALHCNYAKLTKYFFLHFDSFYPSLFN